MPGILLINVLGCIMLGFLLYEAQYAGTFSPAVRTFFGAGFIGAFTTFFDVQLPDAGGDSMGGDPHRTG